MGCAGLLAEHLRIPCGQGDIMILEREYAFGENPVWVRFDAWAAAWEDQRTLADMRIKIIEVDPPLDPIGMATLKARIFDDDTVWAAVEEEELSHVPEREFDDEEIWAGLRSLDRRMRRP
jgi:hypothetical protein